MRHKFFVFINGEGFYYLVEGWSNETYSSQLECLSVLLENIKINKVFLFEECFSWKDQGCH